MIKDYIITAITLGLLASPFIGFHYELKRAKRAKRELLKARLRYADELGCAGVRIQHEILSTIEDVSLVDKLLNIAKVIDDYRKEKSLATPHS